MRVLSADTLDDCFAHDTDRLSHAAAIDLIMSNTSAVVGTTRVALDVAMGHFTAAAIRASRAVPGHDNSAVDGYAIGHPGTGSVEKSTFTLTGRIAAGDASPRKLGALQATRIFTGARLPDGADTVVMQEDAEILPHGKVRLPNAINPGANRDALTNFAGPELPRIA